MSLMFQETSAESFEESLMAGGYGRYVRPPFDHASHADHLLETRRVAPGTALPRRCTRLSSQKRARDLPSAAPATHTSRVPAHVPVRPTVARAVLPTSTGNEYILAAIDGRTIQLRQHLDRTLDVSDVDVTAGLVRRESVPVLRERV